MQGLLAHFGYFALLAALLAAGVGVPIPEEVTQLTVGVLIHERIFQFGIALPLVWVGIMGGDLVLFLLARRHGPRLLDTRAARRFLTPARRAALHHHFSRHAFLTIVVARHAGALRFPTFVFAATHGVPLATFAVADGLSAAVSVPIVVGAGYLFWDHIAQAKRNIRIAEVSILAAIAVAFAIFSLVRRRRRIAE